MQRAVCGAIVEFSNGIQISCECVRSDLEESNAMSACAVGAGRLGIILYRGAFCTGHHCASPSPRDPVSDSSIPVILEDPVSRVRGTETTESLLVPRAHGYYYILIAAEMTGAGRTGTLTTFCLFCAYIPLHLA